MCNSFEITAEMDRAEKAFSASEILYKSDLYEDSLSRCYYAILHAAKAALLCENVKVESHDAVKRLFGKELVKTGFIENDFAVILREEQDDRLLADYDVTYIPDKRLLEHRIADARRFIERIKLYLNDNMK